MTLLISVSGKDKMKCRRCDDYAQKGHRGRARAGHCGQVGQR